ncbi:MAG: phosphohistidine phosphatase [Urechidicola sp.]|jgi:phosphohistidine phosphatase
MSVELLLLRHGHASMGPPSWDDRGDFGRQLSEHGKKQSARVGEWISSHHLEPDAVVCSSAVRTVETAIGVCAAAELDQSLIDFEDAIYEAEVQNLVDVLCRTPKKVQRLLFVGHNPGLEMLARKLVGNVPRSITGEIMPPATLVHIVLDGGWSQALEASASCQQIFRP